MIVAVQYEPGVTAPVQAPYGTISWAEHVEAWTDYAKHHKGQSAERIAERGGFGHWELGKHLGHAPLTFQESSPRKRR